MRNTKLQPLISKAQGASQFNYFVSYQLLDPRPLIDTALDIMRNVAPSFGACAPLSAVWAAMLNEQFDIPAIAVAGDLKISRRTIFKCKKNIPEPTRPGAFVQGSWDGHCWVEINGFIGDLSLFRTAYAIDRPSILKEFVFSKFGIGKKALICPIKDLPSEMQYIPKHVLNNCQIDSLIAGLGHQQSQTK